MGESEETLLGLMERNLLAAGPVENGAELFGQAPEIDDDSKIVEKSGEISFARIGIGNLAREMAADQSASERVLPEHDGIDAMAVFGGQVENAAGHGNVTDALKAKAQDCGAQRIDLLPSAEQRAIGHLQALRSQCFVLGDHIGDFLNVEIFGRLLQIPQQRSKHGGNSGDLLETLNSFQKRVAGIGAHGPCFPAWERSPFTYAVAPGR